MNARPAVRRHGAGVSSRRERHHRAHQHAGQQHSYPSATPAVAVATAVRQSVSGPGTKAKHGKDHTRTLTDSVTQGHSLNGLGAGPLKDHQVLAAARADAVSPAKLTSPGKQETGAVAWTCRPSRRAGRARCALGTAPGTGTRRRRCRGLIGTRRRPRPARGRCSRPRMQLVDGVGPAAACSAEPQPSSQVGVEAPGREVGLRGRVGGELPGVQRCAAALTACLRSAEVPAPVTCGPGLLRPAARCAGRGRGPLRR